MASFTFKSFPQIKERRRRLIKAFHSEEEMGIFWTFDFPSHIYKTYSIGLACSSNPNLYQRTALVQCTGRIKPQSMDEELLELPTLWHVYTMNNDSPYILTHYYHHATRSSITTGSTKHDIRK